MTLSGNRVFTDDQVKMRSQPKVTGIRITVLMTGGYLDTDTATQGECHMKREDWRDVSTSFLLPEDERAARNRLSRRRLRKNQLCPHLDFGLLASILRQCIYVVLSYLVCGTLLWHPPPPNQETDTLSITLVPRQDKIHPLFHDILGLGGLFGFHSWFSWFPFLC